jgi:hypothetical protein
MLKQTVRFACLALFMFAASATPLTAKAAQQDTPLPQPDPLPPIPHMINASDTPLPQPDPLPPVTRVISALVNVPRLDSPLPQPDPLPPITQVI